MYIHGEEYLDQAQCVSVKGDIRKAGKASEVLEVIYHEEERHYLGSSREPQRNPDPLAQSAGRWAVAPSSW